MSSNGKSAKGKKAARPSNNSKSAELSSESSSSGVEPSSSIGGRPKRQNSRELSRAHSGDQLLLGLNIELLFGDGLAFLRSPAGQLLLGIEDLIKGVAGLGAVRWLARVGAKWAPVGSSGGGGKMGDSVGRLVVVEGWKGCSTCSFRGLVGEVVQFF